MNDNNIKGVGLLAFISENDNSSFVIPSYQRKYVWDFKSQVVDFLNDIVDFTKTLHRERNDAFYFMGTIVIKKDSNLKSRCIVVDGQQRITTLVLIVTCLWKFIEHHTKNEIKKCIQNDMGYDFHKIANQIESNYKSIKQINIEFKDFNDQYGEIKENKFFEKINTHKKFNYLNVYSGLKKYFIETFIHNKNQINTNKIMDFYLSLKKISVALININPLDDEHLIFESINSKGHSLKSSDLIKNFISSKLNEDSFRKIEKIMHKNIGDNSNDLDDFYCQILAIETGVLFKKNGKELYKAFRKYYTDFNNDNANHIIKSSIIWKYIHEYAESNNRKIKFYPLLFANLLNYYSIIHVSIDQNSNIDIENLFIKKINNKNVEFVLMFLSKLVVSRTLVSFGRVEGNRTYASMAYKLNARSDILPSLDYRNIFIEKIVSKLKGSSSEYRFPKWSEINSVDDKKVLYPKLKNQLKWIFLTMEFNESDSRVYWPNKHLLSIEHIFPQKPIKNYFLKCNDTDDLENWLDTIGNLALTDVNSKLSNLTIDKKNEILKNSSYLKMNKLIYEYDEWNLKKLKERATKLISEIDLIWELSKE